MSGGGLPQPDFSRAAHVVIDMQGLFADHPDWAVPDIAPTRKAVQRLAERKPERTYWTRFVPAKNVATARGSWKRYYGHWPRATLEGGGRDYVDLLPEYRSVAERGRVFDKPGFSAYSSPDFTAVLEDIDTLIISGVETDVCVWATALDAIDAGLFVALAKDAMTSGSLEAHTAILDVIARRYDQQILVMDAAELEAVW